MLRRGRVFLIGRPIMCLMKKKQKQKSPKKMLARGGKEVTEAKGPLCRSPPPIFLSGSTHAAKYGAAGGQKKRDGDSRLGTTGKKRPLWLLGQARRRTRVAGTNGRTDRPLLSSVFLRGVVPPVSRGDKKKVGITRSPIPIPWWWLLFLSSAGKIHTKKKKRPLET